VKLDTLSQGAEFAGIVRAFFEKEVAPLRAEIARLSGEIVAAKAQPGEPGEPGPPGEPGKDGASVTLDDLAPVVLEAVATAVAALPKPENGKDADPETIRAMVAEAVAQLPPAKDGEPGRDADPAEIERMVGEAVAALPKPQDGKSVAAEDVAPLIAAEVAKAVSAIPAAKDGVGLAGALIDRDGNLVLTLTDGSQRELGPVVGKDGSDGEPGKDGDPGAAGFSLDHFDTEMRDGGRTLVLKFEDEGRIETHELGLDAMIYRGVFKEGSEYEPGDTVSYGGGLWHCGEVTRDAPGEQSKAWSLAVRRGRDGSNVKIADVMPAIEKRLEEIEQMLVKRLDMALARAKVT
jgi:hypothetical protein